MNCITSHDRACDTCSVHKDRKVWKYVQTGLPIGAFNMHTLVLVRMTGSLLEHERWIQSAFWPSATLLHVRFVSSRSGFNSDCKLLIMHGQMVVSAEHGPACVVKQCISVSPIRLRHLKHCSSRFYKHWSTDARYHCDRLKNPGRTTVDH